MSWDKPGSQPNPRSSDAKTANPHFSFSWKVLHGSINVHKGSLGLQLALKIHSIHPQGILSASEIENLDQVIEAESLLGKC